MKAQLTAMAASIRGKVAGSTFRNVGGQTIISTTSASLKGRLQVQFEASTGTTTSYTRNFRGALAFFSRSWEGLSEAEKATWFAVPINNKRGRAGFLSANLSARGARSNTPLIRVAQDSKIVIPSDFRLVRPGFFTINMEHSIEGIGFGTSQVVYISPAFNPSVQSPRNRFRFLRGINANFESMSLQPYIRYKLGTLQEEMRYFLKVYFVKWQHGQKQLAWSTSFIPSQLPNN